LRGDPVGDPAGVKNQAMTRKDSNTVLCDAEDRSQTGNAEGSGAALGAIAADFRADHGNLDSAVALDLPLQLLEEAAFEFPHFAAAEAGNVDMIARCMALIEVPVAAEMEQIELVNEPVALQQINRAVNGDAVDAGIEPLRPAENVAGIEMPPRRFHHLEKHAALAGQPDPARGKLLLQPAGRLISIDALPAGNTMCWGRDHGLPCPVPDQRLSRRQRFHRIRKIS